MSRPSITAIQSPSWSSPHRPTVTFRPVDVRYGVFSETQSTDYYQKPDLSLDEAYGGSLAFAVENGSAASGARALFREKQEVYREHSSNDPTTATQTTAYAYLNYLPKGAIIRPLGFFPENVSKSLNNELVRVATQGKLTVCNQTGGILQPGDHLSVAFPTMPNPMGQYPELKGRIVPILVKTEDNLREIALNALNDNYTAIPDPLIRSVAKQLQLHRYKTGAATRKEAMDIVAKATQLAAFSMRLINVATVESTAGPNEGVEISFSF